MRLGDSMRNSQKIALTLEALHKTKKNKVDLSTLTHFTCCLSAKQFLQQLGAPLWALPGPHNPAPTPIPTADAVPEEELLLAGLCRSCPWSRKEIPSFQIFPTAQSSPPLLYSRKKPWPWVGRHKKGCDKQGCWEDVAASANKCMSVGEGHLCNPLSFVKPFPPSLGDHFFLPLGEAFHVLASSFICRPCSSTQPSLGGGGGVWVGKIYFHPG